MARVTVEDCIKKVGNRFDLVLLAARRTKQLAAGVEPKVSRDNDKPTVLALREIALGLVDLDSLNSEDKIRENQEESAMAT